MEPVDPVEPVEPPDSKDAHASEFESGLRKKFKRASDEEHIEKMVEEYHSGIDDRLDADEHRPVEDIQAEERLGINTNLLLSVVVSLVFVVWSMINADQMLTLSTAIKSTITANMGWFFVILSTGTLIYLAYLAFSRFGDIVLGQPDDKPEFSDLSWYSMLFSAGMGVGIVFWGATEPLTHFFSNPAQLPGQTEQIRRAFALTMFHWGFHGWGVYTLCAVAVAYYGFRRRKNYLMSSAVAGISPVPWLERPLAVFTDLTATLAIVFGLAASLGTGTLALSSGLESVLGFGVNNAGGRILILSVITIAFVMSATTGLEKGIKILSNLNMLACVVLLAFVFLVGSPLFSVKLSIDTIGGYLTQLPSLSFQVSTFDPDYEAWMAGWTITYFTWWIAWAPFVGIFIARISKGRTIKELVLGSLIVPVLFTVFWFAVFGGSALLMHLAGDMSFKELLVPSDGSSPKFQDLQFLLLSKLPFPTISGTLSCILIFTFLVTSADSACFVLAMMTSEGNLDPSMKLKLFWALLMAGVTALLVREGKIGPIQAVAQMSAIPFSFVLLMMSASLPSRLRRLVKQKRI